MSDDQKISLELAIKLWGTIITATLGALISVLLYIYFDHRKTQAAMNEETTNFISQQRITNNVVYDMFNHYHSDADIQIMRFLNKHESLNKRSMK